MVGWGQAIGAFLAILNKFIPSRRAALVDEINKLTVEYQKALQAGKDTQAATLKKRLTELRRKVNFTNGDV